MKLDGYSQLFAAKHPETGEIDSGAILTPDQAVALGDTFSTRIIDLSRKKELTPAEETFLDTVTDLGSRCITYGIEAEGLPLPGLADTITLRHRIAALTGDSPEAEDVERVKTSLARSLHEGVCGGGVSVRQTPHLRPMIENYAADVMPYFAGMVRANGGLTVSNYLAGNLKNLLAHYEMAEASTRHAGL